MPEIASEAVNLQTEKSDEYVSETIFILIYYLCSKILTKIYE